MSLKNKEITICLALAVAVWLAGGVAADDRDFLRERAAEPNMIFIVDTSGSMVGSPETPGQGDSSRVAFGMVPGGGDDPYSRMGIAKAVLRDFLTDVTEANYAFAGYAQANPADGSNAIPQKHWVYEAKTQDHYHLVEANYAYRIGLTYAQTYAGTLLDNPGEIFPERLIGYNPYFDPATSAVRSRFGPVSAYDTGYVDYYDVSGNPVPLPYDLMPINFSNCVTDEKGTPFDDTDDVLVCKNRVFPFYPSANRDLSGNMIPEEWYYGDLATGTFPNCVPYIAPVAGNPDDGCMTNWMDTSSGVYTYMRARRVQLNMPLTNPDGDPNHPLGVLDPDGVWNSGDESLTGNKQVADLGPDDYDLDPTTPDADYDGNKTSDWILYVDMVEEQNYRTCGPPEIYPTWTPTNTPTNTPTRKPATCSQIDFVKIKYKDEDEIEAEVSNGSEWDMKVIETSFQWEPNGAGIVSFKGDSKEYWKPKNADTRASFTVDESDGSWKEAEAWYLALDTKGKWTVKSSPGWTIGTSVQACLTFNLVGGGVAGADLICGPLCQSIVVPTPKPTAPPKDTKPPADTPDPSWTATNTPQPKDTKPPADTATPVPKATNTPVPATNTPKPTSTPKPPTATPLS